MLGIGIATLSIATLSAAMAGFDLLHLGPADKVVRVVVFPDQPGFWETYQTLASGILAVIAGALAFAGAVRSARIAAATAENDRKARFDREDNEGLLRTSARRATVRQQAVVMVLRETMRLSVVKAFLVREAVESRKRAVTCNFRESIEGRCRINIPNYATDIEFADCFTPEEIAPLLVVELNAGHLSWRIENITIKIDEGDLEGFRKCIRPAMDGLDTIVDNLSKFAYAVEPNSAVGTEVARIMAEIANHLTPPPPESAPKG